MLVSPQKLTRKTGARKGGKSSRGNVLSPCKSPFPKKQRVGTPKKCAKQKKLFGESGVLNVAIGEASGDVLCLKPPPKQKSLNMKECIICQDTGSPYTLSKATKGSIKQFCEAVHTRQDSFLSNLDFEQDIFWHRPCYAGYVSRHNLVSVMKRTSTSCPSQLGTSVKTAKSVDENEPPMRVSRSSSASINWSNCIICGKRSHKQVFKLFSITSEDTCRTIKQAAELKCDQT